MTVPSYTEDLTDLSTAESNTSWVEMSGTITLALGSEAFNAQGIPAGADGDYPFIQGSFSVTQDCTKNTAVGSLAYNNGSGTGGHGTDGAYFAWQNYMVASNIETYANDGFMGITGSGLSDFYVWVVGGRDKSPYPYGGWVNHAWNTSVTPDYTAGTPTATEQYIGVATYVATGSSKGEVHNADVIRYGRGSAIFEFGEAADYADIAGFAAQNDNSSNRWGLIQETSGGYLWKGRMQLGTATNAVDFRDSNVNIFVQWTPKVTANFNLIECINASSNIEMTGFNITCLDTTTASQGRFLMTDQCDVAIANSAFVDMDTFVFDKGGTKTVTIDDTTFSRCGQITTGGASFTGCTFNRGTGATAVLASSPANAALITNSTFTSDGTGNGLEITGTAADLTLTNMVFSGYSASVDADKAIYVNISTGTVNITISGGSGISAASEVRTAGATVNILNNVTFQLSNVVSGSQFHAHAEFVTDTPAGTYNGTGDSVIQATVAIPGSVPTSGDCKLWNGTRFERYAYTGVSGQQLTGVTPTLSQDFNGVALLVTDLIGPVSITTDPYSTSVGANINFRAMLANASGATKYTPILFEDTTGSGFSRRIEQVEDA